MFVLGAKVFSSDEDEEGEDAARSATSGGRNIGPKGWTRSMEASQLEEFDAEVEVPMPTVRVSPLGQSLSKMLLRALQATVSNHWVLWVVRVPFLARNYLIQ